MSYLNPLDFYLSYSHMGISKSSNFEFSDYKAAAEQAVKTLAILTSSIRVC
jgi:hypothetical protein